MPEVNRCIALTAEMDVHIRSHGAALERLMLEWYVYQVAKLKQP
jgi:hypothetical protein